MKKTAMFLVAMMLAVTSIFATDLQQAVSRAAAQAQQNQVCSNPLEISKTTFNGLSYVLYLSNSDRNYYAPEKSQGNYLDWTTIQIKKYGPQEANRVSIAALKANRTYDLVNERDPLDKIYAFQEVVNDEVEYYVLRVITTQKGDVTEYKLRIHPYKNLLPGEEDFRTVVEAHRVEWIEALANWEAPQFDPRSFFCQWPAFR